MKFSQLHDKQAQAIITYYVQVAQIRAQEEQYLTQSWMRLLAIGNGAGVALIASFFAAQPSSPIAVHLVRPLIAFLIGATLVAVTYIPLIAVAANATNHVGSSVEGFIYDRIDVEQLQGYGLNPRGKVVVGSLLLASISCFVVGVYFAVAALRVTP